MSFNFKQSSPFFLRPILGLGSLFFLATTLFLLSFRLQQSKPMEPPGQAAGGPTATATPTIRSSSLPGFLAGRVTDSRSGQGIGGARVKVTISGVKGRRGRIGETTTASSGWYPELKLNSQKYYLVEVSARGYQNQAKEVYIYPQQVSDTHFSLEIKEGG